jgi:hypothetical protein
MTLSGGSMKPSDFGWNHNNSELLKYPGRYEIITDHEAVRNYVGVKWEGGTKGNRFGGDYMGWQNSYGLPDGWSGWWVWSFGNEDQ